MSVAALPLACPTPQERAILRTVVYASLFEAPVSLERLPRILMDVALDARELRRWLSRPFLRERLECRDGWVFPRGRGAWLRVARSRRRRTRALLGQERRSLERIARFPYVRLAALSGACAHDNAEDSDVDVFLVVRRGRAWAVCLALMVLCKVAGKRRRLCLNYIVDQAALELPERDLFTASELVGLRPLAGAGAYRALLEANRWAAVRYPNFFAGDPPGGRGLPPAGGPRWLERVLDLCGAALVERGARAILRRYFRARWRGRPLPGVVLDPHRIKLHTLDHGPGLLAAFHDKVHRAGAGLD